MASLNDLPRLLSAQDWSAAERVLRKAAGSKTAPAEVFYNLAKVLEETGKSAQRETWLKRAVAKRPDYALAWYELGRASLDAEKLTQAVQAFERAANADPCDVDARRMVARLAIRMGAWDKALTALQDDADPEAARLRYRALAERGADVQAHRDALLEETSHRPDVLRLLTRVAKGSVPLRLM